MLAERRRMYRRRRLVAASVAVIVLASLVWGVDQVVGGPGHAPRALVVPSIEAGVEPWQLPAAVSREAVVPTPTGFTVIGGLDT